MSDISTQSSIPARVQFKHHTESDWIKTVYQDFENNILLEKPFIPMAGEPIVYDPDESNGQIRYKIGDGQTNVVNLPFITNSVRIYDAESRDAIQQVNALSNGADAASFGSDCQSRNGEEYDYGTIVVRGYDHDCSEEIENKYFYKDEHGNIMDDGNHTKDLGVEEQPDEMGYYVAKNDEAVKIPMRSNYSVKLTTSGAKGDNAFSEGFQTLSSGNASHSEGRNTFAGGNYSHAEGHETTAFGYDSHAEGHKSSAEGQATHSEGMRNTAIGKASHAEGLKNTTDFSAFSAHAEGEMNYTGGIASHIEGRKNFIYGDVYQYDDGNIAIDEQGHYIVTELGGNYSHAEGFGNVIAAQHAHAEGYGNIIEKTAIDAHVEGHGNKVAGECGHAEGRNTIAEGARSHAEGSWTQAIGNRAHAEGEGSIANGDYSHAEGYEAKTDENAIVAHAEGFKTRANAPYSHAEGANKKLEADGSLSETTFKTTVDGEQKIISGTEANGIASHAEGSQSATYGFASHAEGYRTLAIGNYSHAQNNLTEAQGDNSHAEGLGTVAQGNNQHVQGKYNIIDTEDKYAHIIGNGTGLKDTARKNIHTVDWDGNAWFKGDVYIGSAHGKEQDAGSHKVVTSMDLVMFPGKGQNVTAAQQMNAQAVGEGSAAFGTSKINTTDPSFDVQYVMNDSSKSTVYSTSTNIPSQPTASTRREYKDLHGTQIATFKSIYSPIFINTGSIGAFSHSEGCENVAGGYASHAEGRYTNARAPYSHAEGWVTFADGGYASHAEGYLTTARGHGAHAEGVENITSANGAHTEGSMNTVLGGNSHAEGEANYINAFSNVEKTENNTTYWTTESLTASHAEGRANIVNAKYSHAEGNENRTEAMQSHVEGSWNFIHRNAMRSHAEGTKTIVYGRYSHAEGDGLTKTKIAIDTDFNTILNTWNNAEDKKKFTAALGSASHAEGKATCAAGVASHAEGECTQATGNYSHAEGSKTTAYGNYGHAGGIGTWSAGNQYVIGHYNAVYPGETSGTSGTAFIIGNGTSRNSGSTSNAFRVDFNGSVYSKKGTITTGADYAEYFEWLDLNPNQEDRRGYFVTL